MLVGLGVASLRMHHISAITSIPEMKNDKLFYMFGLDAPAGAIVTLRFMKRPILKQRKVCDVRS